MQTDTVRVWGVTCELGCWVEGHWGQYGPDHLFDKLAMEFPATFQSEHGEPLDDVRSLRTIYDALEAMGYQDAALAIYELRHDMVDRAERWLNDGTPEGYSWGWHDGEFYLWPTETWEEEG